MHFDDFSRPVCASSILPPICRRQDVLCSSPRRRTHKVALPLRHKGRRATSPSPPFSGDNIRFFAEKKVVLMKLTGVFPCFAGADAAAMLCQQASRCCQRKRQSAVLQAAAADALSRGVFSSAESARCAAAARWRCCRCCRRHDYVAGRDVSLFFLPPPGCLLMFSALYAAVEVCASRLRR